MDESDRTMAALISFNATFILAGMTVILLELGRLGWGVIFAFLMVMEGSFAYAVGYDGWNRKLWETVEGAF